MSELRDMIGYALADRESVFGDLVENLRTGFKFMAEIEAVQDLVLQAEMGRDPRESTVFHVLNKKAASEIQSGDKLFALGERFEVLGGMRKDNPVSQQVDFGCMKLVKGKDYQ